MQNVNSRGASRTHRLSVSRTLSPDELAAVAGGSTGLVLGSQHSDQSLNFAYGHTAYAAAWQGGSLDKFDPNFLVSG